MKNVNKSNLFTTIVYLLFLCFYFFMSYVTTINMQTWNNVYQKLELDSNLIQYNHIYITFHYFILSTYLLFKSLKKHVSRIFTILAYTISYIFAFIALYKYYTSYDFIKILLIANGLIIGLNLIYKKIHASRRVF